MSRSYLRSHTYLASASRLLNKCMKNSQYLEDIYESVKALGLVENQCEFSVLCGRTPAWFSAIKARGLPLTADAALTLSLKLKSLAETDVDVERCATALNISDELIERVEKRISKRLALFDF